MLVVEMLVSRVVVRQSGASKDQDTAGANGFLLQVEKCGWNGLLQLEPVPFVCIFGRGPTSVVVIDVAGSGVRS